MEAQVPCNAMGNIMKHPKDITVSLEVSEKLKEAGWEQDKCFYKWWEWDDKSWHLQPNREVIDEWYRAAPTVQELLEELPVAIPHKHEYGDTDNMWHGLEIQKTTLKWEVAYRNTLTATYSSADSLADASAKMWIWLKENELLTPPTI